MNVAQMEKRIALHHAFASEITAHLSRLWGRPVTSTELSVIRDATLCCSFMSLESSERWLANSDSSNAGDDEFAHLRSEVDRHRATVLESARNQSAQCAGAPDPAAYIDLLAWEEAFVQFVAQATN